MSALGSLATEWRHHFKSPLRPEKRTSDGTVTRQFAVTRQMDSSPISWVGLFQEKTEQNQKRIFALVPGEAPQQFTKLLITKDY
jgi:hypothetical protein